MKKLSRLLLSVMTLTLLAVLAAPAGAGSPLGQGRFLIENAAVVVEQEARVAYNSRRGESLVVWQGNGIWGRRVGQGGTLLGSAFQIAPTGFRPDVTYNNSDDQYFVVWHTAASVQARLLSAFGAHQSGIIEVAVGFLPPPGVDGWYYDQARTAYASTSDRYLVVYRYRRDADGSSGIRARSFLSTGAPEASDFAVSIQSDTFLPEKADVAYNRSRNEFLVVWQMLVGPDVDVYGRRVKMTGGSDVLGDALVIANLIYADEVNPAVGAIPTLPDQGQYLVAWERDGDILAATVSGTGSVGLWRTLAATGWGEYRPAVAGNEGNDQFLVTWTWIPVITPPARMEVLGRSLALDGTPAADTLSVGGGQVFDSAVVAGAPGDFLVVFDDNEVFGTSQRGIYGRLWGNRLHLPLVTGTR